MFGELNNRKRIQALEETLEKRIQALEETFEKLQRDFNALKLEWADALEKITRMAGRVAKRSALMQEKEDLLMGKELPEVRPDGQQDLPGILTPRQARINAQIAARRQQMRNGGG
jgi:hypothetical protein